MYNKNPNKTQLDVLYTRTLSKAMGGPNNLIMTAREALKTQSKKDAIR